MLVMTKFVASAFWIILFLHEPAQADWMTDEYKLNASLCILRAVNVYHDPFAKPTSRNEIMNGVAKICVKVFVIWTDYIGMNRSQADILFGQAINAAMDGRDPLE